MKKIMTDLDLPEAYRTQANLWKAKFFEATKELSKANKGVRRLKAKNEYLLRCILFNNGYYQNLLEGLKEEDSRGVDRRRD